MTAFPEMRPDLVAALTASADRIRPFGMRVVHLAAVGSTNDVAGQLATDGAPEGTLVVADAQTAGRGRMGHTWYSPSLAGLYASVVLRPSAAWVGASPELVGLMTLTAGVAVAEGVRAASGPAVTIKWPNDIVVCGDERASGAPAWRKLAGILAEGVAAAGELQHVVLGYGVNLLRVPYPPEIAARVTSIQQETGRAVDRNAVLVATLSALARWYAVLAAGDTQAVLARWRALSPSSVGAQVSWNRGERRIVGVTAGVDRTGALLVETSGGQTDTIGSGEVTWL
jgi:BirA family biotin operon repressor/biotin-[acetyl-CoA-carboxylase] ligase